MSAILAVEEWMLRHGLMECGPHGQTRFTDRAVPYVIAAMVALALVVAWVEGHTVIVPC